MVFTQNGNAIMNLSCPKAKYARDTQLIAKAYGLSVFITSLVAFSVLNDTIHQAPPVKEIQSMAHISMLDDRPELTITRHLEKFNNKPVRIRTELINPETRQTISLASGKMIIDSSGLLQSTFVLPSQINGKWCIDADLVYSYGLSLTEHTHTLKDICVEIPKQGNPSLQYRIYPKEGTIDDKHKGYSADSHGFFQVAMNW